ncbi:purine permease 3 [Setaria italica]|uniref:purine permease 3 n=1 Tax=Setaria italica TaxID=4555 RepID=UPI0003514162|nr:purine permease 3 [Setaria italica]
MASPAFILSVYFSACPLLLQETQQHTGPLASSSHPGSGVTVASKFQSAVPDTATAVARNDSPPTRSKTTMGRLLVALNCTLLALGGTGGQLLSRLYYINGGQRQWLSAGLQTGGWPLLLIPLAGSYASRRARDRGAPVLLSPPRFLLAAAGLGVITGVDDFLYAWGLEFLPVSTSAILISTQLVFTVLFSFLIVRHRLTAATVNAVALLTVGGVVLGLHVSSDRPEGVTRGQYWLGFVLTLGAAALGGVLMPLVELAYKCAAGGGRVLTYSVAMELQLVIGLVATAFFTAGMIVNKDFQAIPSEAKRFELGEARYYTVLVWAAVLWQFFFLGAVGVIFCVHTLLAGILIAVFIPVTEVAAVIFLHEKFSSEKGVALVLSLWGLASYSYGEWNEARAKKNTEAVAEAQAS